MDNTRLDSGTQKRRIISVPLSLFLGAGLGAASMWLGLYWYTDHVQARQIDHLQGQLQQAQTKSSSLAAQRDALEGQLAVETSTRKGLEATLEMTQGELGVARNQVAFFEELLPPGPAGAVSIRRFEVQQKGNMLAYKVLLMRRGANTKSFEGVLQFQANGQAGEDAVTVLLEPMRIAADTDEESSASLDVLGLNFEQFQSSSGLLKIPEGLVVSDVTLNVLEGKTLRVSRTVNVATPLPND